MIFIQNYLQINSCIFFALTFLMDIVPTFDSVKFNLADLTMQAVFVLVHDTKLHSFTFISFIMLYNATETIYRKL